MPDRPNILWYCTDQQRFDTIGSLNNPHIQTPRLDAFMNQATTFTHAFCQSTICTPSRASFLTGQYPSAVHVNRNGGDFYPPEFAHRLLPRRLADSGYECGLVGKLHLAGAGRGQEPRVQDGYTYFQYSHSHKGPLDAGHDYADWMRGQGGEPAELMEGLSPDTYRDGAKVKSFGGLYEPTEGDDNIPPHLHQSHWCTVKSKEFISRNRHDDQPWLLSVNPFDPHPPFDAPWDYYRRYDPDTLPGSHFEDGDLEHQQKLVDAGVDFQSKPQHPDAWQDKKIQASYYASIELLDEEFGNLLDFLDDTGQRENTIIIFTSDHGESLADHGLILKGCRLMEGMVRVPLMISWPGHFQQDVVSDALVELMDIAPTLYEAAGEEIPYWVQGRSLTGILTGDAPKDEHRDFVRTEFYGAIDHPDGTHATMYRDHRWKLIMFHGKDLYELYDLENDPWEHNDLSDDPDHQAIKWDLIRKNFDATVFAHPIGPPRSMPF